MYTFKQGTTTLSMASLLNLQQLVNFLNDTDRPFITTGLEDPSTRLGIHELQ
jgi:hypothetical protein